MMENLAYFFHTIASKLENDSEDFGVVINDIGSFFYYIFDKFNSFVFLFRWIKLGKF